MAWSSYSSNIIYGAGGGVGRGGGGGGGGQILNMVLLWGKMRDPKQCHPLHRSIYPQGAKPSLPVLYRDHYLRGRL